MTNSAPSVTLNPANNSENVIKYIIVSGGVISGIGKGVIASSTGLLLRTLGFKVTSIKIDPYLNIDAGTMTPLDHGMYMSLYVVLYVLLYVLLYCYYMCYYMRVECVIICCYILCTCVVFICYMLCVQYVLYKC